MAKKVAFGRTGENFVQKALGKEKTAVLLQTLRFYVWWSRRDLNLRHQHYECCALTN